MYEYVKPSFNMLKLAFLTAHLSTILVLSFCGLAFSYHETAMGRKRPYIHTAENAWEGHPF
jgi:hypothetical protein